MKRILTILTIVSILFVLPLASNALASTLEIVESPQTPIGNFIHNIFTNGGQPSQGSTFAWFDLATGITSSYNPDNGLLQVYFNVYNDYRLRAEDKIGIASAMGTLPGADFNDNDNQLIGTIDWLIRVDPSSLLYQHIDLSALTPDNLGGYSITIPYYDTYYNLIDSRYVNSWQDGYLSMFGYTDLPTLAETATIAAHCPDDPAVSLGTNFVLRTAGEPVVPEPASLLLLTSGLFGIGLLRRKK